MLLIFVGAAIFSTVALFTRQPMLVVYLVVGCLLGPHVFDLVSDAEVLSELGEMGIIFLLFIVGLELPPIKLKKVLGRSAVAVLVSSLVFFAIGFTIGKVLSYSLQECIVLGIAGIFSSTVLAVKLLPTTILHHRHIGEIVIGLLLLQDVVAILALLYLATNSGEEAQSAWVLPVIALPIFISIAYVGSKYVVWPLLRKFDVFTEFTFVLFIGWCLGLAGLAYFCGLTLEIGAFIAGVALANSRAAQSVAQTLEPLRDFFIILFFFYVGSSIDPAILWEVSAYVVILSLLLVVAKPLVFHMLLKWQGESSKTSWEVGFRMGQCSEFSLLIAYVAVELLSAQLTHVILGTTVLTMLISTYLVVFRYPSPIAPIDRLRVS